MPPVYARASVHRSADAPRCIRLLLDAHPDAATRADGRGLAPLHVLCKNTHVTSEGLLPLLELAPSAAAVVDKHGRTALHHLCVNPSANRSLLEAVLSRHPAAKDHSDHEGRLPVHLLVRTLPEDTHAWDLLMPPDGAGDAASTATARAALRDAASGGAGGPGGAGGGGGGGGGARARCASSAHAMPVMAGRLGVAGIVGRVKDVVAKGDVRETRADDRGLLLFVSSMGAVKMTAEACKQAQHLLDALLIRFEVRDVFVNLEYANQLRRLHAAHLKQSGEAPPPLTAGGSGAGGGGGGAAPSRKPLPPLPQLYANGRHIGSLDELRALDDEGQLAPLLDEYHADALADRDLERVRDCDQCGGRRFVVCRECNGSRRGRQNAFGSFLKCSHCNENGLVACTACGNGDDDGDSVAVS